MWPRVVSAAPPDFGIFGQFGHDASPGERDGVAATANGSTLPHQRPAANECCSWKAGVVTDFTRENLTGSRFEDVYLTDARFHDVDLTNARFHLVDLTGVVIRGAALVNVDISGEIENLRVNGVDVVEPGISQVDVLEPGAGQVLAGEVGHPTSLPRNALVCRRSLGSSAPGLDRTKTRGAVREWDTTVARVPVRTRRMAS